MCILSYLQLQLDGFGWSTPFSIENEGMMCVSLKKDVGIEQMNIRVEVRSGVKNSCYEVIFRLASFSSPYRFYTLLLIAYLLLALVHFATDVQLFINRIENLSMFFSIRFRQVDRTDDSWQYLPPNAAASFFWEDLGRQRLLEVIVDGTDPSKSQKYNIDGVFDHHPLYVSGEPVKALHVTVLKEGRMHVVKISDWMPARESVAIASRRSSFTSSQSSENDLRLSASASDGEFHAIIEFSELGISIIDHTPEEILYLSISNLLLSYSTGLGAGISR